MPQLRSFSSPYLPGPRNQSVSSSNAGTPSGYRGSRVRVLGILLAGALIAAGALVQNLQADIVLDECFTSSADGSHPPDWMDTGFNNSMVENDSLFQVWTGNASNRIFGTKSTLANIHSHLAASGCDKWADYEFSGKMWITSTSGGMGVTFLSNYPVSDAYYRLAFVGTLPWRISAHGTKITGGQVETFVYPAANTWYNFRVLVTDEGAQTRIQARVWKDGVAEPTTWQADCYDSSTSRRKVGTVGVWTYMAGSKYYDDFQVSCTAVETPNQPPQPSAGEDVTLTWPENKVTLAGKVTDDGLPNPPGKTSVTWGKVSGPGTVTFNDENSLGAIATFSAAGEYVLGMSATDGEATASDEVTITITEEEVPPPPPSGTLMENDFTDVADMTRPADWLDTGAENSMAQSNNFLVYTGAANNRFYGTKSTLNNIHSHYVGDGAAAWANYEYSGRMLTTSLAGGTGVTFLSNYPNSDAYYRLAFVGALPWRLSSHGTNLTSGTIDSPVYPVANTWYRFRVKVTDTGSATQIQARVWADGTTEPTTWQMDCVDNSATRRKVGTVGLWCYSTGSKYWDDLKVVAGVDETAPVKIQAAPATGEAPLPVEFEAVCRETGATLPDATYTWDFGDGTDPMNGNKVNHTFTAAGSYMVTLSMALTGVVGQVSCDQFAIQVTQATLNQGVLAVSPDEDFASSGNVGGPFSPASSKYTLSNTGQAPLDWTAAVNVPWLTISPANGELAEGATTDVTVTINAEAAALTGSSAEGTVTFTNATTGAGNATRKVALTISGGTQAGNMTTASRTSGVAPLLVFFDAIPAASGVTQPSDGDYARLHYQWDFGDANSGNWLTTGRSRNKVNGYCAAHVFNEPGTYNVKLTVTTPDGQSKTFQQTITATAFSGSTFYVSSVSGNDGNDGLSEGKPLRSFAKAMSKAAANTRILFKRGESWTEGNGVTIWAKGPGIVGAYGTGNQPTITMTGRNPLICVDNGDDWRITDLHLVGPMSTSDFSAIEGRNLRKNLILRVWTTGFRTGLGHGWIGAENHAENGIVDCFVEQAQINNMYLGGKKLAVMGNRIERCQGSHLLRTYHIQKGVINNNILWDPGGDRLSLKLHNEYKLNLPESCFIVISENDMRGQLTIAAIGPQQETPVIDERIRDVVFEKNILRSTSQTQGMSQFACRRATIRNNIYIGTGCMKYLQFVVRIWKASGEPAPDHMRVYNNTFYKADNGSEFTFALVTAGTDLIVRNNIAVAPAFTGYTWTMFRGGVGTTNSNNLLTKIQQYVNPAGGDFNLLSNSAGRNAGMTIPEVYDDYVGAFRPQGGGYDIGALEQ